MNSVQSEISPYLLVQYRHKRMVQPLRGELPSEAEQKRRGQEARKRLLGTKPKPPKPLAILPPSVSQKPRFFITEMTEIEPVENPKTPDIPEPAPVDKSWDQPGSVPYDEISEIPATLPVFAMQGWRDIVREVAYKHGFTFMEIISPRREHKLVVARHECCWRLKNETPASLPRIGRWLGGRDHTTVIAGIRRYKERNGL